MPRARGNGEQKKHWDDDERVRQNGGRERGKAKSSLDRCRRRCSGVGHRVVMFERLGGCDHDYDLGSGRVPGQRIEWVLGFPA
jgi:hypothetical protein